MFSRGFLFLLLPIFWGTSLQAVKLENGDILLQELDCYACPYIEAQERTRYAHMGLYLEVGQAQWVLEAWGEVRLVSLAEFKKRSRPGTRLKVRRLIKKHFQDENLIKEARQYLGLSYDQEFLWDNFDDKGEKLYCSELITKVLQALGVEGLPLKAMTFDVNPEFWLNYFQGNVPWYEPGNSPADFERSEVLFTIGEL